MTFSVSVDPRGGTVTFSVSVDPRGGTVTFSVSVAPGVELSLSLSV